MRAGRVAAGAEGDAPADHRRARRRLHRPGRRQEYDRGRTAAGGSLGKLGGGGPATVSPPPTSTSTSTSSPGSAVGVSIRFEEGFSRPHFAKKARQLSQLSDEGKLYKAPNPVARDRAVTANYKRDVIRRIYDQYGTRNRQFADAARQRVLRMDVDDVHELQLGGPDSPDNLQLLHSTTNQVVGTQQIWPQIRPLPD